MDQPSFIKSICIRGAARADADDKEGEAG